MVYRQFDGKIWRVTDEDLLSKYQVISKVGEGAFGNVFKVRKNNEFRAMKVMSLKRTQLTYVTKEVKNMIRLSYSEEGCHPSIVCFYEAFIHEETNLVYVITEYIDGNTLEDIIFQQNGQFSISLLWSLIRELVGAIKFMHNRGIAHKDIKPGNIMLDVFTGMYKLIDLGFSCDADNCNPKQGTPLYYPPELLRYPDDANNSFEFASRHDIWDLGMVLYEAANHRLPLSDTIVDLRDLFVFYKNNSVYRSNYYSSNIESISNSDINNLIDFILNEDPSRRPTINEIEEKILSIERQNVHDVE